MAINSTLTKITGRQGDVVAKSDVVKNSIHKWPSHCQDSSTKQTTLDHFIIRNGIEFAGTHLILDFWEASRLNDIELMERALKQSVEVAEATLLHLHLHHFTPSYGISGVAVLAESHISVHTWPERGYAAFDIFMCGNAKPEKATSVLKKAFAPARVVVTEHLRGMVSGR